MANVRFVVRRDAVREIANGYEGGYVDMGVVLNGEVVRPSEASSKRQGSAQAIRSSP